MEVDGAGGIRATAARTGRGRGACCYGGRSLRSCNACVLARRFVGKLKASLPTVLQELAVPSYADTGILFWPFYEGNKGTAIYNSNFRPFQSPAPFIFVRSGVMSDWKFFLDNEEMLNLWASRFGESAVQSLAEELRRLPWRANPPQVRSSPRAVEL